MAENVGLGGGGVVHGRDLHDQLRRVRSRDYVQQSGIVQKGQSVCQSRTGGELVSERQREGLWGPTDLFNNTWPLPS